jgi:hypothetical protein
LKTRFESQLSRMNCHTFSTGFNSGALGGNSKSVMFFGTSSFGVVCQPACMPACLVEQDDSVGAGIDFGADERKVLVHGMGVGIGHDQPRPLSLGRADGTEDIGPFGALILGRGRA